MGGKKKKQAVQQEELKPKAPQIVQLMDKSDMDKTQFISFLPEDAIYPDKVYLLKDDKYLNVAMRELLKQLNWLRYLSFKQFWATVQFNLSLKYCLESCLMFLQRRKYNQYIHEQPQTQEQANGVEEEFKDKPPPDDSSVLEYQKHIYQMLLIIYFRVLQAQDQNPQLAKQFKCAQSVYDNWIFDIPKLFNFMDVYGESNPEVTKLLVEKVFYTNPDYKLDFIDVLTAMSRHIFPDIFQEFKFLHDRSEFQKELSKDTFQRKMKHFLSIKDITSSFLNIFNFFPFDVHVYVITSFVLAPLENVYYEIYAAYKNWEFHQYTENVHALMDSIQEDLISIWKRIFQTFREAILEETNMRYIKDFGEIKDIAIENMNRIGEEFGVVASQGKKGKEKRNYMLLEQIMEDFDFQGFLNQILEAEDKRIHRQKISQLLNVVQKLSRLKEKRLHPEIEDVDKHEVSIQTEQAKVQKKSQKSIGEAMPPVKKQSSIEPQKKEDVATRMQKARKPRRIEKTNERQYEDEYDDFYDYNRKIQQNVAEDSESQIQEIPQNFNRMRKGSKNEKQLQKSNTGGKQQKNYTYVEKSSKGFERSQRPHYKQVNRGDDNSKRGGRKADHQPVKKQYRQK